MKLSLLALCEQVSPDDKAATRSFYASRPRRVGPSSLEQLHEVRARQPSASTSSRAMRETVLVDGQMVRVRIIEPLDRPIVGVYLYMPGGGLYASTATASDARGAWLADNAGVAVVTVDYRLAPEFPWPAAPDDCETAARWLLENASERFGTDRVVIGGTSAGSTLAAATLFRLRDRGLHQRILGAVLEAATYDLSSSTPCGRAIGDEYFIEAYVGNISDRTRPDISPAFGDLADLPPTLVVVGTEDFVLADNLTMAAQLSAAGNNVDLRPYPGVPHGFVNHPTPVGRMAHTDIADWITQRIDMP